MYVMRCGPYRWIIACSTHSLFEYVDRVCVCVFFYFACRLFAKSFIDTKFRLDHPVSTSHRLLLQFNSVRCHSVSSSKLFSLRIICIHIFQNVFSLSRSLSRVYLFSPFIAFLTLRKLSEKSRKSLCFFGIFICRD